MMLSDVMEDYLKAIYYLQGEDEEERIRTSEIADHLDVTSPTVTSMLEKLEERGLVDREKYEGVRLTEEGETVALEVLRHHRLLEAYLTEHLDYDWSEVHDEADRLEHHISEKFERRLAELLDDPEVDPHGDPIPNEQLDPPPADEGRPLTEFDAEDRVAVARIEDGDAEILRYLAERGIEPGAILEITDVAPFGVVTVRAASEAESCALPEEVALEVLVTAVAEELERA
ncbi:metal-dependent transcriptional regulator [Salinarchaeum chitinilyticum]